jgi:hypothetical protein
LLLVRPGSVTVRNSVNDSVSYTRFTFESTPLASDREFFSDSTELDFSDRKLVGNRLFGDGMLDLNSPKDHHLRGGREAVVATDIDDHLLRGDLYDDTFDD